MLVQVFVHSQLRVTRWGAAIVVPNGEPQRTGRWEDGQELDSCRGTRRKNRGNVQRSQAMRAGEFEIPGVWVQKCPGVQKPDQFSTLGLHACVEKAKAMNASDPRVHICQFQPKRGEA